MDAWDWKPRVKDFYKNIAIRDTAKLRVKPI